MTHTKMQNTLFTEYDDIVGISEIQKMLGIGKKAALDFVKLPQIHGIKIGNKSARRVGNGYIYASAARFHIKLGRYGIGYQIDISGNCLQIHLIHAAHDFQVTADQ